MSTSPSGRGPSISQHLRAAKKALLDAVFNTKNTTLNTAEVDVLEQDAFEVLRLTRSLKNGLAPINRTPPEILTLVPDFWDEHYRDKDVITLTHVCQVWRKIFISRSSLWTDFGDCLDVDKTRVYLERSRTSPITLFLIRDDVLSPQDPLQIIPRAVGRLESLFVGAGPGSLQDITAHLSHPAPLLRHLSILSDNYRSEPLHNALLPATLFNGVLSSLHTLHLQAVRTGLPWRNMVNLTSFTLDLIPPGEVSITQILDFFESAPRLREVQLKFVPLASCGQNGRLVSLARLKYLIHLANQPSPLLFEHLLIPVGAELQIRLHSSHPRIEDSLPRSLDNLRNLPNFTRLHLNLYECDPHIEFIGPNGKLCLKSVAFFIDNTTDLMLGFLARFDTSTAKQLVITGSDPLSEELPYQALVPMQNLHALTISRCKNLPRFIRALDPDTNSSNALTCPRLEELVLCIHRKDGFDVESVARMAAARTSRGAKLQFVRIVSLGREDPIPVDVSELSKHVSHVEHGCKGVDEDDDDSDDSDDNDDSDDEDEDDSDNGDEEY